MYDIRLKENFKTFISGPSRCGKTTFVIDLIDNIFNISSTPPTFIIYVFKVWQYKFDEMTKVNIFLEDDESIVEKIMGYSRGQPLLIIFDDMINSKSLPSLAPLFNVDGRHMNLSLVFLSQRLFVNDEHFRQISQNCDYFVLFKNPRNSSEIRTLANQMTPTTMELVKIYLEATKSPFSYLFINLTQEACRDTKYLSDLFSRDFLVKSFVVP